ncbi:MAG: hypothetical protein ABIC04_00345 [Nanoarchaeota archaeon]
MKNQYIHKSLSHRRENLEHRVRHSPKDRRMSSLSNAPIGELPFVKLGDPSDKSEKGSISEVVPQYLQKKGFMKRLSTLALAGYMTFALHYNSVNNFLLSKQQHTIERGVEHINNGKLPSGWFSDLAGGAKKVYDVYRPIIPKNAPEQAKMAFLYFALEYHIGMQENPLRELGRHESLKPSFNNEGDGLNHHVIIYNYLTQFYPGVKTKFLKPEIDMFYAKAKDSKLPLPQRIRINLDAIGSSIDILTNLSEKEMQNYNRIGNLISKNQKLSQNQGIINSDDNFTGNLLWLPYNEIILEGHGGAISPKITQTMQDQVDNYVDVLKACKEIVYLRLANELQKESTETVKHEMKKDFFCHERLNDLFNKILYRRREDDEAKAYTANSSVGELADLAYSALERAYIKFKKFIKPHIKEKPDQEDVQPFAEYDILDIGPEHSSILLHLNSGQTKVRKGCVDYIKGMIRNAGRDNIKKINNKFLNRLFGIKYSGGFQNHQPETVDDMLKDNPEADHYLLIENGVVASWARCMGLDNRVLPSFFKDFDDGIFYSDILKYLEGSVYAFEDMIIDLPFMSTGCALDINLNRLKHAEKRGYDSIAIQFVVEADRKTDFNVASYNAVKKAVNANAYDLTPLAISNELHRDHDGKEYRLLLTKIDLRERSQDPVLYSRETLEDVMDEVAVKNHNYFSVLNQQNPITEALPVPIMPGYALFDKAA